MNNLKSLLKKIEAESLITDDINDFTEYICNLLYTNVPYYNWVGFYILKGNKLHLGKFSGKPTLHTEIEVGKGICGTSAKTLRPILVPDIADEKNYLACSPETRSEIVVPIIINDKFWGEIDIDSDTINAFSIDDKIFLKGIADLIVSFLNKNKEYSPE